MISRTFCHVRFFAALRMTCSCHPEDKVRRIFYFRFFAALSWISFALCPVVRLASLLLTSGIAYRVSPVRKSAVLDFLCALLCRSFSFAFTHFGHSLPGFTRPEIRCLGLLALTKSVVSVRMGSYMPRKNPLKMTVRE